MTTSLRSRFIRTLLLPTTFALATAACGGDSTAGGSTSTSSGSSTVATGGSTSTATTSSGTGGAGGSTPESTYGALSGSCGVIDAMDLTSASPQLLQNVLDFTMSPMFDPSLLSPDGQVMVKKGNLGGNSLYSEVFAYEVLHRCEGAKLLKTEAEIVYATEGKKTDFLASIAELKVGVSVVRAESYPEGAPYPDKTALDVLTGKLSDILQSSVNVAPEDAWKKQILSVIAQTPEHAAAIAKAYDQIDAKTKSSTIVLITETEGEDHFIYYNK